MVVHKPNEKIHYYQMTPPEWRQFKKNNELYCIKYGTDQNDKEIIVGGKMAGDYIAQKGVDKGKTIPVDAFYVLAKNKSNKNVWVPFSPMFASDNQSLDKYYTIYYCSDESNPKLEHIPKKIPGKDLDFYTKKPYDKKNRYFIFDKAFINYDFNKALSNNFIKERLLGSNQDSWYMNVGKTPHIIHGSNLKEEEIERLKKQKTITDEEVGNTGTYRQVTREGLTIAIKWHKDRKNDVKTHGEGYIRIKVPNLL